MPARRVVITGLGVVSSLGLNVKEYWQNCLAGRSFVEPIPAHWHHYAEYQSTLWIPLPELDYKALGFSRMEILQHDPVSLMAMYASQQAVESAQLAITLKDKRKNTYQLEHIDNTRCGVFMGTGIGGYHTLLENYSNQVISRTAQSFGQWAKTLTDDQQQQLEEYLQKIPYAERFNPFGVPMTMSNAVSASVGIKYTLHGANRTFTQACSSSTLAIGQAFKAIQNGELDYILCGGSEYTNDYFGGIFRGFDIAKTLVRVCDNKDTANRPFDKHRSGFLYSEGGAAVLLLEEYHAAKQRGAPMIAEIAGFAETFDAHNLMSLAPENSQLERMLQKVLDDAQLAAQDIDYINTHGTGTQINDQQESDVIQHLFGDKPLINTSKSLLGHTLGASGALEAVITALSIQEQTTHVCHNLETAIADLNFVKTVQKVTINNAISQSFAFGGHNIALLLKSIQD